MKFQAIILILIIFSSYFIFGDNDYSREKAAGLAISPSFKEKIFEKTVNMINVVRYGIGALEIQAERLTAMAKEIGYKGTEADDAMATLEKNFNHLPSEESDSQIAVYEINAIKEMDLSNKAECGIKEKDSLLKSKIALAGLIANGADIIRNNANLIEFNSAKRWPIASLSKLMTSVIVLERIGEEKEVRISANAVNTEGKAGGFKAGEIFKAEDLIKAMLVISSNNAAMALAEDFGKENFVDLMNQKAKELGMGDTYFEEPTGLSFLNQSTAADLAKLAAYIYKTYPQILEISRQKETTIKDLNSGKLRKLLNINKFVSQSGFIGQEIKFLGGKTGYIDESGKNLISFFNKGEQIILTVVLGAENAYNETKKIIQCNFYF